MFRNVFYYAGYNKGETSRLEGYLRIREWCQEHWVLELNRVINYDLETLWLKPTFRH